MNKFKKLHFDIDVKEGDAVVVVLAAQTSVWLMDHDNYAKYRSGQPFTRMGGFARHSPVQFLPSHGGHWHLLVDQDEETPPLVSITVRKADGESGGIGHP
jgi:hypothetical protein